MDSSANAPRGCPGLPVAVNNTRFTNNRLSHSLSLSPSLSPPPSLTLSLSLSLPVHPLVVPAWLPSERKGKGPGGVSPLTNDRGRVCAMRVDPEIAFIYERYIERYRRRDLSEKRFTS